MNQSEILEKLNQMRIELDILRSMLTPPKKRPRVKRDYTKQIHQSLMKTPHLYKK